MSKRLILFIFFAFLGAFALNAQAALMSLSGKGSVGSSALGSSENNTGNMQSLGSAKIVARTSTTSGSCPYTSANCQSPKILSGAVGGISNCFKYCECPANYIAIDTNRENAVGIPCDGQYPSYYCKSTFISSTGSNRCACPTGYYIDKTIDSSWICKKCPAGSYCVNEEKNPCPIGSSSTEGSIDCTGCNPGTISTEGSSDCTTCTNNANVASWSTLCNINSCDIGYVLINNSCVKCTYSTPTGYQTTAIANCADAIKTGVSMKSNPTSGCASKTDSYYSSTCDVCETGYKKEGNDCVIECSLDGYNLSGNMEGVTDCQTCNEVTMCKSCANGYYLSGTTCHCDWSNHPILNSDGAYNSKTCGGETRYSNCYFCYSRIGTSCIYDTIERQTHISSNLVYNDDDTYTNCGNLEGQTPLGITVYTGYSSHILALLPFEASGHATWYDAPAVCESLGEDWFLPDSDELTSIMDDINFSNFLASKVGKNDIARNYDVYWCSNVAYNDDTKGSAAGPRYSDYDGELYGALYHLDKDDKRGVFCLKKI